MPLRRAMDHHRQRPVADQVVDEAQTADEIVPATDAGYRRWKQDPAATDYPGVDTPPEPGERAIDRMGYLRPLTRHSLRHTEEVHQGVPEMAGFGGWQDGGHNSWQGVDDMALGYVDAMAELRVQSRTAGPPLTLAPDESVYSDDIGHGMLGLDLDPAEDPGMFDWQYDFVVEDWETP